jgi:hypothetical protein
MKAEQTIVITYHTPKGTLSYTLCGKSTIQKACRKAFRYWIKLDWIKNQPKTDLNSPTSFENTQYAIHRS